MIISIDAEKALDKNLTTISYKNPPESGHRGTYLNIIKVIYDRPTANIILNSEKLKEFPRAGARQGCPVLPLLFNIVLDVLSIAIKEEKEIKGIQFGKEEVKLSLFADDRILYTENPKDTARKLVELISEFRKVVEYKVNTQKSIAFLYTINKKSEKLRKQSHLPLHQKEKKYLGINVPKETKDLYSEIYKMLMKAIKDDTNRWKEHSLGLEESMLSK